MAGLALEAETSHDVTGVARARVITHVTALACHRRRGVIFRTLGLMAGATICDGVHAGEGKPLLQMQIDDILAVLPVFGSVALLANQPHLPLMGIGVAVGAGRGDTRENEISMATRAPRGTVRSDQREFRFIMRESQGFAHLRPGIGRMALLAIPLDVPMRVL